MDWSTTRWVIDENGKMIFLTVDSELIEALEDIIYGLQGPLSLVVPKIEEAYQLVQRIKGKS